MRGRLIKSGEIMRDDFEEILFAVSVAIEDLDEIIIRNRQAVRRTQLVSDVLNPGIERLVSTQRSLSSVRDDLKAFWSQRQNGNWRK